MQRLAVGNEGLEKYPSDVFAGDPETPDAGDGGRPEAYLQPDLRAGGSCGGIKAILSWYMVAQQDRFLSPELRRFYAKRMRARIRPRSGRATFRGPWGRNVTHGLQRLQVLD